MRKRLLPALLALLALCGCARARLEEEKLHILCTTYPMYLLTTDVVRGFKGAKVEVELLVNSQTSCLHDYTLTVDNMKAIERADVIVMNGAGLEDFMADALSQSQAAVIDCSEGMELLPPLEHEGHEGHDHGEEQDPHYWMDPYRAMAARDAISDALVGMDHGAYEIGFSNYTLADPASLLGEVSCPYLITFHDGFQYFADVHGLTLLRAIEEEEGSTASAQEIKEIVALMEEYDVPAIFVEKNGSRATAEVIARETGCEIYELDLLMSGDGTGLEPYFDAMRTNRETIQEALS